MLRLFLRRFTKALLWFAGGSVVLVLIFRVVPPPGTALMVERKIESWVDGKPIVSSWPDGERPAKTELSDRISKDLSKRGFKFVGSTIIYAHMQATGMVNDHVVSCFRHAACGK